MTRRFGSAAAVVAIVIGTLGAGLLFATAANAATFNATADPTVDGDPGSLRAAILAATNAGGDEIILEEGGTYTLTCAGGGALSHGATPLTITGNGATIEQTCADSRVLGTLGSLTLDRVAITGGNGATGDGAGVFANTGAGATFVINGSLIAGNTSTNSNASGGGIYTSAVTTITDSLIVDNHASGTGSTAGGIYSVGTSISITDSFIANNSATINGGGIRNGAGTLSMTRSLLTGNDGGAGVGASGGGLLMQGGNATIVDSEISDNQAWGGAGLFRDASGIGVSVTVTGSTISGNVVGSGGGGGATSLQPLVVVNSTVTDNTGTGLSANVDDSPALSLVYATVVSNSDADAANVSVVGGLATFGSVIALPLGGGPNCNIVTGVVTSSGFNYSDDTSCALTSIGDVQGGTPPTLGALAENGGVTLTREPAVPGPLVDKIPLSLCTAGMGIVVDQRGFPRPKPDGALCDIGAVEVQQGPPLAPLTPSTPGGPASGLVTITPRFTG